MDKYYFHLARHGALQLAIVDRVRKGKWAQRLLTSPGLVLDGPEWLGARPGVLAMLTDLVRSRAKGGHQTVVCQPDHDGSLHLLAGAMEAGSVVVIGLRFPSGRRGRKRFARRVCDELGLPISAASGTEQLEPWSYQAVLRSLRVSPGRPAQRRHDVVAATYPSI